MTYAADHQLQPYLEKYRQAQIYTYDIVTQGVGESAAATMIDDIVQSQKEVSQLIRFRNMWELVWGESKHR